MVTETGSQDVQVNARFKLDMPVPSGASSCKGFLETSLCSSFEYGKLPRRQFLKSCDLRDLPSLGLCGLTPGGCPFTACTEGPTRQEHYEEWKEHLVTTPGLQPVWSCWDQQLAMCIMAGDSDRGKGLMTSETCSLSTLFLKWQTTEPVINQQSEIYQWMDLLCYSDS